MDYIKSRILSSEALLHYLPVYDSMKFIYLASWIVGNLSYYPGDAMVASLFMLTSQALTVSLSVMYMRVTKHRP